MAKGGASGERESVDEVVEGGERSDFGDMLIGFAKAKGGDGDVSLLLYLDNILS